MVPTIKYFQIRGRAEIPRMLCEVAGVEYESIYQEFMEWPQEKQNLVASGLNAQGALPIYHDDEIGTLTQSKAIARYLAKKFGFNGKNPKEEARIDESCEAIVEVLEAFTMYLYSPDCLEKKNETKEDHERKLGNLENFLFNEERSGSSNPEKYLVGDSLSLADFYLVFLLDAYAPFRPDSLAQFKKLSAFRKQFHQIPNFKAYCESDRRPKVQNASFAKFGAKPEETQQGDE